MQKKITGWKTKGMNRDLSASAFSPEFSFENWNIRLSTNDGNTMMSWVNERGPKELSLYITINPWASTEEAIENLNASPRRRVSRRTEEYLVGTPIGTAVLNNKLVIFTTRNNESYRNPNNTSEVQKKDFIYLIEEIDSTYHIAIGKCLYNGNLGFDTRYPLETHVSYEADHIQKVYWTDGLNQPRLINIAADDDHLMRWNTSDNTGKDTFFDFVPALQLKEDVTISCESSSEGLFSPGVIQYALTYINKYGQQSNVVYTSPLYYLAHTERGASPEEKVTSSFNITVRNVDHNFDFLRVYSIQRTSSNLEPIVKLVQDIKLPTQYYVDIIEATGSDVNLTLPIETIVETEEGSGIYVADERVKGAEIDGEDFFCNILPTMTSQGLAEWENSNSISFVRCQLNDQSEWETTGTALSLNDFMIFLLQDTGIYRAAYKLEKFYAAIYIDKVIVSYLDSWAGEPENDENDENDWDIQDWGIQVGDTLYLGQELFYSWHENAKITKDRILVYSYSDMKWRVVDNMQSISVPDVEDTVSYIDVGNTGSTVDPFELLYVGGHEITALTMEEKDNTLFLGNISESYINTYPIQKYFDDIRESETGYSDSNKITFDYLDEKRSTNDFVYGLYQYKHVLKDSNSYQITTFKGGDTYRFGFQLQKATGEWSTPIFLDDATNPLYPKTSYMADGYSLVGASAVIDIEGMTAAISETIPNFHQIYKRIRPLIVYPEYSDRNVLCQGVVNPTMFNVRDRIEKSIFAQPSWFYRPYSLDSAAPASIVVPDGYYSDCENSVSSSEPSMQEGDTYYTIVEVDNIRDLLRNTEELTVHVNIKVEYSFGSGRRSEIVGRYFTFDNAIYLGKDVSGTETYALTSNKSLMQMVEEATPILAANITRSLESTSPLIIDYTDRGFVLGNDLKSTDLSHILYYSAPPGGEGSYQISFFTTIYSGRIKYKYNTYTVTFTDTDPKTILSANGSVLPWKHYQHINGDSQDSYTLSEDETILEGRAIEIMGSPHDAESAEIPIYANNPLDLTKINTNMDYYIDHSIITLNSPDLEFNEDLSYYSQNNLKFRIVGVIPITSGVGGYKIDVSSPMMELYHNVNFGMSDSEKNKIEHFTGKGNLSQFNINNNLSYAGGRRLCADYLWDDIFARYEDPTEEDKERKDNISTRGFVTYAVYPWHREGSLSNDFRNKANASSWLSTKKLSTLMYSYNTEYFACTENIPNVNFTDIECKCHLYSNTQVYNMRMVRQSGDLSDIDYFPNIDKILYNKDGYFPKMTLSYTNPKPRTGIVQSHNQAPWTTLNFVTYVENDGSGNTYDRKENYIEFGRYNTSKDSNWGDDRQYEVFSPVQMKYKSGTHAVISFNRDEESNIPILPYAIVKDDSGNLIHLGEYSDTSGASTQTSWGDTNVIFSQDSVELWKLQNNSYDFLWLGELYQEVSDEVRFGGKSMQALKANKWLPAGEAVSLEDESGNALSSVTLKWLEGDTYYQRYDSLKTVPFTKEDQNQIIEILSFMCETRYNICGRYDANRGQADNTSMSYENFNKMNPVYSQRNNYFSYKVPDLDKRDRTSYQNNITYSKTKTSGADVDLYTNITLGSVLELDGDKGKITSLNRLDNNLIAFQDTGISQILYNENVQINSTEGVPIEIANSGKVQGKRYISSTIGCNNKWSIVPTLGGLFFMNSSDKDIYLFNGQLVNISQSNGMHSWTFQNVPSPTESWSPDNELFNNFVGYFDGENQEVVYINSELSLSYSLKTQTFTSFYDYGGAPYFCNVGDVGVWLNMKNSSGNYKLWEHNAGKYCNFFGKNKPYSITLVGNPEPQLDKVFTNLEMRAVIEGDGEYNELTHKFTPALPFSSLETWDDYQHGIANLVTSNNMEHHTSDNNGSLLRKFRIWRCDIPRNNYPYETYPVKETGETEEHYQERVEAYNAWLKGEKEKGIFRYAKKPLDRMRNPWLYLKLEKSAQEDMPKVELHDLLMTYFE